MSQMVLLSDDKVDKWEQIQKLKNQGVSDTAIGKQLGIPRKEVIALHKEWTEIITNDAQARDIALELLHNTMAHYDDLISEHYSALEKIRNPFSGIQDDKYLNLELKALAQIGQLAATRLDMVQKAGLLENSELGDELADMEEKASILIDILRNDLCDVCRKHVASKLSRATGTVEVVSYSE